MDDDGSQREYRDPIPWQLAFDVDVDVVCGGVLLSNLNVLSAAHWFNVLRLDGNDKVLIGANMFKQKRIYYLI